MLVSFVRLEMNRHRNRTREIFFFIEGIRYYSVYRTTSPPLIYLGRDKTTLITVVLVRGRVAINNTPSKVKSSIVTCLSAGRQRL